MTMANDDFDQLGLTSREDDEGLLELVARAGQLQRQVEGEIKRLRARVLGEEVLQRLEARVAARVEHDDLAVDPRRLDRQARDGIGYCHSLLRFARMEDRSEGRSALRLYEISFVIDEVTAEDLRDALAERYGPPRHATQNVSSPGALPVYVWENAVSSITLCFLPGTRNGTLTYLLKGSDAWVKSVVRQWQASDAEAG